MGRDVLSSTFHGPRIVATAFVANTVAIGCTMGIFGVFVGVAAEELGTTPARARYVAMSWQAVMALGSPVLGAVLSRYSIRGVMLAGVAALALGLVAVSRAVLPWHVVVLYPSLIGVGALCMGVLPASTLVSAWYTRQRGRYLGVSLAGTTAGTALLPPFSAWLIESIGWRDAAVVVAALSGAVAFAVIGRWAVRSPEELGQRPDGDPPTGPVPPLPPGVDALSVLRQTRFWIIVGVYGLLFMPGIITLFYGVEFARERGMSLQGGALLISGRAILGVVGKVALGSACDRWDKRWVLALSIAVQIALWATFTRTSSIPWFIGASLGLGFFGASMTAVQASMVASAFGPRAFAQAMGWLNGAKLPFNVVAAWLCGALFEWLGGSWANAFGAFVAVYVIALLILPALRLPEVEPGSEPAHEPIPSAAGAL